ncbi:MAG: hypothetical protein ACYDCN_08475 [Bacteroidia bacterium]
METTIRVTADRCYFEDFELGDLKYIPREGEHFNIDKVTYKKQAEIMDEAEERTNHVCRVQSVVHHFYPALHEIEIRLYCHEDDRGF